MMSTLNIVLTVVVTFILIDSILRIVRALRGKAEVTKLLAHIDDLKRKEADDGEYCKVCNLHKDQCAWMLKQTIPDRALLAQYWALSGMPGQVIIQWAAFHDLKPSEFLDSSIISNRIRGFSN